MEKLLQIKDIVLEFIQTHKPLVLKILAAMIVIITILVISSVLKKDEIGNTSGNLNFNFGIATEAGKWTYYMEFDDNEPSGIYRVKTNGEKTQKIIGGYYEYINVLGNYIYCLEKDEDDNQYNLVKIKTNGSKKEVLAKNIDHKAVTASEDRVYYFKDANLYSIKTNGSDKNKISDKNIKYYEIYNNLIYYIYENDGDSYIARMKLDGDNNTRIGKLEDDEYIALHVNGSKVYYIVLEDESQYKLYKMNKNGEKEERIYTFSENIENINMQDDAIYYTVKDGDYKICTINYKAANKGVIKKVSNLDAIGISGKWIFYVYENEDDEIVIERIRTNGEKQQSL